VDGDLGATAAGGDEDHSASRQSEIVDIGPPTRTPLEQTFTNGGMRLSPVFSVVGL
jgi:hypothetical protein